MIDIDKFDRTDNNDGIINRDIKNLLNIIKLKILTKFKKSDWVKDFFNFKVKKAFIYL